MAILDNILNKNKNKDRNSFLPVAENNLDEQGDNSPIVGDGTKTVTAQENMQAEQSAALPEIKYPNKPQGLNDGEYEHLLKYYSPEAITKFSALFDPSSGENILQRYYESTMPKPSAPDEKKMRNRQTIAGIADGVSMLSQMISAGKGAHMRERNDFALPKIQQQEKEEQNRYLQLSQRYNDGMFQARVKDFQKALDDYNNGRKGIQGVLASKQKLDEQARQADQRNQYNYYKLGADQANKDRDFALKQKNQESLEKQRDAMVKQGWARVADSKSRTTAYVKKMSSGSGNNKKYQMIFAADPNDSQAIKDSQLGTSVRMFDMNKGEIDRYAREARADKNFMDKHPELTVKSKGLLGDDTEKLRPNEDIAAAYLQEQYENSFTQTPTIPSLATQPYMNWGQMQNFTPNTSLDAEDVIDDDDTEEWNDNEGADLGSIANF